MAKSLTGKLVSINGSKVTVELSDEIDMDMLKRFSAGKRAQIEVFINDGRTITVEQRHKIYALLHDMSDYTGYWPDDCKYLMKSDFVETMRHPKNFSLADCSVSLANEFMTFIIDFLVANEIPFKTKVFDEIQGNYGLVRRCVENRTCIICGRPGADIDHFKAIGAGRNRRTINQTGMEAWSLCRLHHQERHNIGIVSFAQKYQIKPIRLDKELIEKLNLTNKRELEKQDVSNRN
ncbi:putative HNHc nuclease [Fructilactobacillus frigidiflavus]|uniref:putative HNHc nuclease n=1 Tax=Fructilactobacillus frigidiflavus TaxID=3242688 RepID=UPI0037571423